MSNEPCPSCGAAMAIDQRYCLACGARRAEARLDYLEILRHEPAPAGPALVEHDRQRVNTTVVASIGCLLLAMGIGVLIGNSGTGETAAVPAAAPAQVIKVQGGGAATADAAPAAGKAKRSGSSGKRSSRSDVPTAKTAAESKATRLHHSNGSVLRRSHFVQ